MANFNFFKQLYFCRKILTKKLEVSLENKIILKTTIFFANQRYCFNVLRHFLTQIWYFYTKMFAKICCDQFFHFFTACKLKPDLMHFHISIHIVNKITTVAFLEIVPISYIGGSGGSFSKTFWYLMVSDSLSSFVFLGEGASLSLSLGLRLGRLFCSSSCLFSSGSVSR